MYLSHFRISGTCASFYTVLRKNWEIIGFTSTITISIESLNFYQDTVKVFKVWKNIKNSESNNEMEHNVYYMHDFCTVFCSKL